LVSVPEWLGNAPMLDSTNTLPAFLDYNIVEPTDGHTNLAFSVGALTVFFICDWATADANQNGTGPGDEAGDPAYLLAAGDFSSGSPDGLWAIYFDPGGTNIYFGGVSNSESTVFVSASISWPSNSAHEIDISYDTNTMLYIDGQLAGTGGPVTIIPAADVWTNGFFIGSDSAGFEQARGVFWYLEFFDSGWFDYSDGAYWFFINPWPFLANGFAAWQGSGGGGGPDVTPGSPGALLPDGSGGGGGGGSPDIQNPGTNLWLFISLQSNSATVTLSNTVAGYPYLLLAATNLNGPWTTNQSLLAAANTTVAAPIPVGKTNAVFFEAKQGVPGMLKWKVFLGGPGDVLIPGGIDASPAIGADGTIYITTTCNGTPTNTFLFAIDPLTGNVKWSNNVFTNDSTSSNNWGCEISSSPAIGSNGTI
jgi:hypothetical protein